MTYDGKTGARVVVLPRMIERGAAVVQRHTLPSPKRARVAALAGSVTVSGPAGGSAPRGRAEQ